MPVMMYALPVLPGKEARARAFDAELREHWDEMLALNAAAGLVRWATASQETPRGMLQIHMFDAPDLSRLARDFTDSAYERWWLAYLEDVCGIDRTMIASIEPPVTILDWQAE